MSIQVLEDFIADDIVDKIESTICDKEFPWYWMPSTRYGHTNPNHSSEDFQFTHTMYLEGKITSDYFFLAREVLYAYQQYTGNTVKDVIKLKANLLTKQELSDRGLEESIHIDLYKSEKNYMSMVYYITDSDGDTLIYNDDNKVIAQKSPIKGTAICFPSYMLHRATPPTNYKRRLVLNILFEI